jgi:hypothetical protein
MILAGDLSADPGSKTFSKELQSVSKSKSPYVRLIASLRPSRQAMASAISAD